MKKYLLTAILLIFMLIPANAEVLQGGVAYEENSALNEVMDGISYTIDSSYINGYAYDGEHDQNVGFMLNGMTELKDRTLAYFSDNTYAVLKKAEPRIVRYYDSNGILTYVEKKSGTSYPYKTYKYNTSGKLVNMTLRVSKAETFIYDKNGKLIAHWLYDKAYDSEGNVVMKRKYVE